MLVILHRVTDQAAAQLRFRRALSLLAMTVVLPGSAQLVAGNRRVGVLALRCALGLLALTLLLGIAGWLDGGLLVGLATDPRALLGMRVLLMALAVGWVLLLLDAWRLGDPPALPRRPRLALAGVSTMLVALLTSMLLFSA